MNDINIKIYNINCVIHIYNIYTILFITGYWVLPTKMNLFWKQYINVL